MLGESDSHIPRINFSLNTPKLLLHPLFFHYSGRMNYLITEIWKKLLVCNSILSSLLAFGSLVHTGKIHSD